MKSGIELTIITVSSVYNYKQTTKRFMARFTVRNPMSSSIIILMFNKQARLYIYMSDEIKISRFSPKPNPEGHIFVTEAPT